MKNVKLLSLFFAVATMLYSCKKSNDSIMTSPTPTPVPTINWNEELKETVWAGEFKYTTGAFTDLQPYSLNLNTDGTTTWTDLESTRPGGTWKVQANVITLTFPNSTTISATVSKDTWSTFENKTSNGFEIANLSRSVSLKQNMLEGGTWAGIYKTDTWNIQFLPGAKSQLTMISKLPAFPYVIAGASIKFVVTNGTFTDTFFAIFQSNNTVMKVHRLYKSGASSMRQMWTGQKQ